MPKKPAASLPFRLLLQIKRRATMPSKQAVKPVDSTEARAALLVQRTYRAQIAYRRHAPILVQLTGISLNGVSSPFGGLPSVQVCCTIEDGEGKKSREAGTPIVRNDTNPNFDDFTLSIKLPGCAKAPSLTISVFSDQGEKLAIKTLKLFSKSTTLERTELIATPPLSNCTLNANVSIFRGLEAFMFSTELKSQVKRRSMLRKMGPTVKELAQRDLETGLITVYGPLAAASGSRSAGLRTKRFCTALAARCSARVLFLPSLIASDCRTQDVEAGGTGGRILSDMERKYVIAKGKLPARRLAKIVDVARMRMGSTEPAVLVNFPSTFAELDEIEARSAKDEMGVAQKARLLAAFQLYEVGDKMCPAAVRLGQEGRLTILMADPNRKGRGGLSFAPQLQQAIAFLASTGLACSQDPYPSPAEANELIGGAARAWLLRRELRKQMSIFTEQISQKQFTTHALRWTERGKQRVRAAKNPQSIRHASPESFRRDGLMSGRNKAMRFLDGVVPPLTRMRMQDEAESHARLVLEHVKRTSSPRQSLMSTPCPSSRAWPPSRTSTRLTFFSPRFGYGQHTVTDLYVLARPATAIPGKASDRRYLPSRTSPRPPYSSRMPRVIMTDTW